MSSSQPNQHPLKGNRIDRRVFTSEQQPDQPQDVSRRRGTTGEGELPLASELLMPGCSLKLDYKMLHHAKKSSCATLQREVKLRRCGLFFCDCVNQ